MKWNIRSPSELAIHDLLDPLGLEITVGCCGDTIDCIELFPEGTYPGGFPGNTMEALVHGSKCCEPGHPPGGLPGNVENTWLCAERKFVQPFKDVILSIEGSGWLG